MGVRITATAVSRADQTRSVVDNSGRAARECLERAGVRPEQVGVLINAGVFRDANTVEPAVSALIQKAAGIGLEYGVDDPRTFSFDLMNGAVGVLDAVRVATAILETGSATHVLIVSGDTHPSMTRTAATDDFPYASSGAALLLESDDGPAGFGRVHSIGGSGGPAVEAYVDTATMGTAGRGLMTVVREPDAEQRLLALATEAALTALADSGHADLTGTALIASTPSASFPVRLAESLGISAGSVLLPDLTDGDPHTATLTQAYDLAATRNDLHGHTHVLFVAAGAGPSAAAVLYRLPARAAAAGVAA
ncbi:hypothetical protein [Nocardia cyriacigeorgica]|uniref:hypothetical protein n=1 Tax=Nocardia cyriacigeorgica TaxID=135487 RepID=UPI0024574CB3|nr:hypothetical protein [Nocardia cyriacigeorgica]